MDFEALKEEIKNNLKRLRKLKNKYNSYELIKNLAIIEVFLVIKDKEWEVKNNDPIETLIDYYLSTHYTEYKFCCLFLLEEEAIEDYFYKVIDPSYIKECEDYALEICREMLENLYN